MMRALIIVLLMLNLLAFAWTHNWLEFWGLSASRWHATDRMQQQVRPEALQPALEPNTQTHADRQ